MRAQKSLVQNLSPRGEDAKSEVNTPWNSDTFQRLALGKRFLPDFFQRLGQLDFLQPLACVKRPPYNFLQLRIIRKLNYFEASILRS